MNILFIVLFLLLLPKISWAYLDAGTGSYIIQIILASILGGLLVFKNFWKKIIVTIFKKKPKKKNNSNNIKE